MSDDDIISLWLDSAALCSSCSLTSRSLVRTGCSLSELLTTYWSTGSAFPLAWIFPVKADIPTPHQQDMKQMKQRYPRNCGLCLNCLIPVSTTASPAQKSSLIFAAMMLLWVLLKKTKKTTTFIWITQSSVCQPFLYQYSLYLFWLTFERMAQLIDF